MHLRTNNILILKRYKMKPKKYDKTFSKHQIGEQWIIKKCKNGWHLERRFAYDMPTLTLIKDFAEYHNVKLREPIVDDVGNINITSP